MSIDDELEDEEAIRELVTSIQGYIRNRCCIFVEGSSYIDIIHGRLMAFLREFPALVVRDLEPGMERLQRTRFVSLDPTPSMCMCDDFEKCKQCPTYQDLVKEAKGGEENEECDDDS